VKEAIDVIKRFLRRKRGVMALLCIAVLLAAALAPLPSDSFCVVFEPLTPLFAVAESAPLACVEPPSLQSRPAVARLASRAPPSA
jgi:hypothetical protein